MAKRKYVESDTRINPELCNELLGQGFALKDIHNELSFETPATWLDVAAFQLRHPTA